MSLASAFWTVFRDLTVLGVWANMHLHTEYHFQLIFLFGLLTVLVSVPRTGQLFGRARTVSSARYVTFFISVEVKQIKKKTFKLTKK
jgi:hypothetical protein